MKNLLLGGCLVLFTGMICSCAHKAQSESEPETTVKSVFSPYFLIGAAVNVNQMNGTDTIAAEIIKNTSTVSWLKTV